MQSKALLVGVNDYAPVGPGGPDLRGCVNDVRDMAHTLVALGYVRPVPASLRILTDANATRAKVLEGLDWLIRGARREDRLIFYFSGHGSMIPDTSGDETVDAKDETICPHDYATNGMLRDDDLRAVLARVPKGVNMEVILDTCHAGSGTRELAAIAATPEDEAVTYRYVEPPFDLGFFIAEHPDLPVREFLNPNEFEKFEMNGGAEREVVIVPALNHVLWAACRSYQTSAETKIDGVYRGVFTYWFCRDLRRAGAPVTRRRLDSLVSADVKAHGFAQVPQLEGTAADIAEKVFA
jgi:hypothetical protein